MISEVRFKSVHWMLLAVFAVEPAAVLAQQNNASQLQEQKVEVKRDAAQANTAAARKPPEETQAETKAETQTDKDGKLKSVPGGKALGMSILGNQEAPKALVIVPWKGSELGLAQAISTLLDDSKLPIDKEVFMRMLSYYEIRSGTARPAGAPAGPNVAPPASAAPRRKP